MGDYLSTPRTEIHSEASSNTKLAYAASSMQGYRHEMEDAHNCILDLDKGVSLFAIYDGHLGCEVALYCSKYLPEFIRKHTEFKRRNYKKCLEKSFLKFDETLKEESVINKMKLLKEYYVEKYGSNPIDKSLNKKSYQYQISKQKEQKEDRQKQKSGYDNGCVAVLSLVTDKYIYVANIGDCRCIVSEAGRALILSKHHYPEFKIERNRIFKAKGVVTDGRVDGNFNISRAFGDHRYKSDKLLKSTKQKMIALPDTFQCRLTSKIEFLVLVCDGLLYGFWDKRSQEIIDFVRSRLIKGLDLQKICDELLQESLKDGPNDNMSCIIVRFLSNKIEPITEENES